MGKPTGFVEWPRLLPRKRGVPERLRDWREVEAHEGLLERDTLQHQAGRCMDCGVPFCHQGCPLGNAVPEFADLVWKDRWRDAHKSLASTNNFPEFTGRLCPAPCEAACVLAIDPTRVSPRPAGEAVAVPTPREPASRIDRSAGAVTIEAIEKAIVERAFADGWIAPQPPRARTGKRVAIVGSGPAGLAAAQQLCRAGHAVTVYEAAARPGGLLRYGIPDFKLEKHVIDRRLAILEAEGVAFRCGVTVGRDPTWTQLRAEHDATVIAIGAGRPRELDVPGRDLEGVVLAMDYLADQNAVIGGERASAGHDVRGRRVVILGGGDTGSDCVGTALRQRAAAVTQIELLPAPPATRADTNPWPTWPLVFRTSSSQDEGGERTFAFRTTRLEGEAGRLVALHGERVDAPGAGIRIAAEALILALGFTGPDASALVGELGVALDARGNVAIDARHATSVPGVYCAGDAHRGASLIVWAIAEGRELARHVDEALRHERSSLPARGQDLAF
jgi:glutamate synthase (NADPH/NADH) small chain